MNIDIIVFYVIQGDKEWCKFDGESIFVSSKVFRFCILVRVCLLFGLTKELQQRTTKEI